MEEQRQGQNGGGALTYLWGGGVLGTKICTNILVKLTLIFQGYFFTIYCPSVQAPLSYPFVTGSLCACLKDVKASCSGFKKLCAFLLLICSVSI